MKPIVIDPKTTTRTEAYALWMNAPNPMVAERCENHDLTESMVIGTSAIVDTEIDGAVGMNSGIFNNPFIIWGKYHHNFLKTMLTISFQFHHTQMDGAHAGLFLKLLQRNINSLGRKAGA